MGVVDHLGPQNEREKEAFAIEGMIFSTQMAILREMVSQHVSHEDMASRLGERPEFVKNILSLSGRDLTVPILARLAHALGGRLEISFCDQNGGEQ